MDYTEPSAILSRDSVFLTDVRNICLKFKVDKYSFLVFIEIKRSFKCDPERDSILFEPFFTRRRITVRAFVTRRPLGISWPGLSKINRNKTEKYRIKWKKKSVPMPG